MKREDLTKLGLTDDAVIDAIMAAHGKDIEKHKTAVDTSKAELDTLKNQLVEANKQIEDFKGMNIDQIKAAADEWKTKAEKAESDAAQAIASLKFDHALEGALVNAQAKNPKAVKALLEMNNLKLNDADGSIIGLEDQLKSVKEKNDYLFADTKEPPKIVAGGNNQPILTDAFEAALMKGAGLTKAT